MRMHLSLSYFFKSANNASKESMQLNVKIMMYRVLHNSYPLEGKEF